MSDSPLRLAFISHPDDLPARFEALGRVRGGEVTVTADSMEAATGGDREFDAAVVDSLVQDGNGKNLTSAGHHHGSLNRPPECRPSQGAGQRLLLGTGNGEEDLRQE